MDGNKNQNFVTNCLTEKNQAGWCTAHASCIYTRLTKGQDDGKGRAYHTPLKVHRLVLISLF